MSNFNDFYTKGIQNIEEGIQNIEDRNFQYVKWKHLLYYLGF